MEKFILDALWACTASVFVVGGVVLAMTAAVGGVLAVLRLAYFLKVQQEKMAQHAESEVKRVKADDLERAMRP